MVKVIMCNRAPRGWKCTRPYHFEGPCAAVPRWYNLTGWWWGRTKMQKRAPEGLLPPEGTEARRYSQRDSEIPFCGSETPQETGQ